MNVSEQALKAAVRAAIARHTSGDPTPRAAGRVQETRHASHQLLPVARSNDDGSCVIEPGVLCTHCGFCQSFGH